MPLAAFARPAETNLNRSLQLLAHSAKASLKIHPSTATSCSGFRQNYTCHKSPWIHALLVLATALSSEFQTISTCLSFIPIRFDRLSFNWEHGHTHDALVLLVLERNISKLGLTDAPGLERTRPSFSRNVKAASTETRSSALMPCSGFWNVHVHELKNKEPRAKHAFDESVTCIVQTALHRSACQLRFDMPALDST